MALPTFSPPVPPSPGGSRKSDLKILEADFGDGYSQPTPNGINHIRKTVTMSWDVLSEAQMQAIEAFFVAQRGTDAFYFKPFGELTTLKWTCKEWNSSDDSGHFKMTATFRQSFTATA